ncbi:MAG: hypothetical protein WKF30_18975 [Pyrinomonadaceae bacterium]
MTISEADRRAGSARRLAKSVACASETGFGMVVRCAVSNCRPGRSLRGIERRLPSRSAIALSVNQISGCAYAGHLHGVPERPAALAMTFSAVDATLAPGRHTLYLRAVLPVIGKRPHWDAIAEKPTS